MTLDPLIGVAVAATVTERIQMGAGILQVPLRHSVALAHRVLMAQLVSGGRFLLGDRLRAISRRWASRSRTAWRCCSRSDDDRRLWASGAVDGVNLAPLASVKGGPPVLIGNWTGSRWIARAAREFDGWIASAREKKRSALS